MSAETLLQVFGFNIKLSIWLVVLAHREFPNRTMIQAREYLLRALPHFLHSAITPAVGP
jgi:hypothetical protein